MAKQLTIQSGAILLVIALGTFFSTQFTKFNASGEADGRLQQKVLALEVSDTGQNTKLGHLEEGYHTIQTSIAELVLEQRHMNEGIKKLAGVQ